MTGSTANPRVWTNAVVYVATVGSTAPTNIATAWDAAWDDIGLISEDPIVDGHEMESADFYAYGGVLVRTIKSKYKKTLKVKVLEQNLVVADLVWPGSTRSTASGVTTTTLQVPTAPNPKAFGLELVDGTVTSRRVYPRGEVIGVGEAEISDAGIEMRELTINVYPTAAGVLGVDITDDPQIAD